MHKHYNSADQNVRPCFLSEQKPRAIHSQNITSTYLRYRIITEISSKLQIATPYQEPGFKASYNVFRKLNLSSDPDLQYYWRPRSELKLSFLKTLYEAFKAGFLDRALSKIGMINIAKGHGGRRRGRRRQTAARHTEKHRPLWILRTNLTMRKTNLT